MRQRSFIKSAASALLIIVTDQPAGPVALRSMLFSGQVPPFHASSKFQPKVKLSTSQLLRTRPCSICCSAASSQLPGVVALDVEYVHLHQAASVQSGAEKAELAQAAWVAVVDDLGQVLVDQRIALEQPVMDRHQSAVSQSQQPVMVWAGGVPLKELRRLGRPRSEVASAVREAVKGKLLVGHGLNKDLKSLGLDTSVAVECYDLMTFDKFQGNGGVARTLRALTTKFLGQSIQERGRRHDAVQDAHAVMQLFLRVVLPALPRTSPAWFDLLVSIQTRELLAKAKAAAATAGRESQQEGDCE